MGLRICLGRVSDSDGVSSASDGISSGMSMGVGLSLGLWGSSESGELLEGCQNLVSELRGTGRVPGFGVLECRTYGRRGQRRGLNLCVSPSLPEPVCLCISEGRSNGKGSG